MSNVGRCYGHASAWLVCDKPVKFASKHFEKESKVVYELSCDLKEKVELYSNDNLEKNLHEILRHCVAKFYSQPNSIILDIKIVHDLSLPKRGFSWIVIPSISKELGNEILALVRDPIRIGIRISNLTAKIHDREPIDLEGFTNTNLNGWIFPKHTEYMEMYTGFTRPSSAYFTRSGDTSYNPGFHNKTEQKLDFTLNYQFSGNLTAMLTVWKTLPYTDFYHGVIHNPALGPRPNNIPVLESFTRKQLPDLTIIVTETGSKFMCHKEYLSASSSYFSAYFSNRWNNSASTEVKFDQISDSGVEALLQLIYCLDMEIFISNWEISAELYLFASHYAFDSVLDILTTIFLVKPIKWFSNSDMVLQLVDFLKSNSFCSALLAKLEIIKNHQTDHIPYALQF